MMVRPGQKARFETMVRKPTDTGFIGVDSSVSVSADFIEGRVSLTGSVVETGG